MFEHWNVGKTKLLNGIPNLKTFHDFSWLEEASRGGQKGLNISFRYRLQESAVSSRL